jgi:hypothetical protein
MLDIYMNDLFFSTILLAHLELLLIFFIVQKFINFVINIKNFNGFLWTRGS